MPILESLGGLGAVGGFLGGMGQFAGGLSGLFGDDDSGYDRGDHKRIIKTEMRNRLKYAQVYGQKYGIHPLVALGINPSAGPMGSYVEGNRGEAFSQMGQGLQKMLSGRSEIDKAQIEYVNSMTELNKLKAQEIIAGQDDAKGAVAIDNLPGGQWTTPVQGKSVTRGLEQTHAPLFQVKVDPRNRVYFTLGQDTSEGFESHLTNRLRLNFNDIVDYFADASKFYIHWTPAARENRNKLRFVINALEKEMKAAGTLLGDEQLSWDIGSAQPIIVKGGQYGLYRTGWPFNKQKKYSRYGND